MDDKLTPKEQLYILTSTYAGLLTALSLALDENVEEYGEEKVDKSQQELLPVMKAVLELAANPAQAFPTALATFDNLREAHRTYLNSKFSGILFGAKRTDG